MIHFSILHSTCEQKSDGHKRKLDLRKIGKASKCGQSIKWNIRSKRASVTYLFSGNFPEPETCTVLQLKQEK